MTDVNVNLDESGEGAVFVRAQSNKLYRDNITLRLDRTLAPTGGFDSPSASVTTTDGVNITPNVITINFSTPTAAIDHTRDFNFRVGEKGGDNRSNLRRQYSSEVTAQDLIDNGYSELIKVVNDNRNNFDALSDKQKNQFSASVISRVGSDVSRLRFVEKHQTYNYANFTRYRRSINR